MKRTTAFATTDLADLFPDDVQLVECAFNSYGGSACFSGRIRTAVTMLDSKLVQDQLFATPGNGDVIVLDGGGSLRKALLGDMMGVRLIENGWAGIVINGAVRDAEALAHLELGVLARGTTPFRSHKRGIGALDVPLAFGQILFQSGQYIYCDQDGVLISDKSLLEA